jgi:hypothetical protein
MVNSEIYHSDSRPHANFHQPSVNLPKYQQGVYCLDVKVFNMLSTFSKIESDNPKKLKLILQKCLYENSFYSWMKILNFKKIKLINMLSCLVFESLAHKIDIHYVYLIL